MPAGASRAAIRRATHQAHREVERLDARTLEDLTRLYEDAATTLRQQLAAAAGMDERLTLLELRQALVLVEGELGRLARLRAGLLDDVLRTGALLGAAPFDPLSGDGLRVTNGTLMRVSDDALRFVRSFVAKDGLQLSDRVWRIDQGAREAVVRAVQRAIVLGQSAEDAARDLLARGDLPPAELLAKARAATSSAIGAEVEQAMTGAAYEAKRLFRTELNRAHGEAYMKAGADHPDLAGWRYVLSPAHPRPDICDLLSEQNLYGLGKGVYPTRELCPWPAHPNILSFVEIVFKDEVTEADRAGRETSIEALQRLGATRQKGVLGTGKYELFHRGELGAGAIRATLAAASRRAGA